MSFIYPRTVTVTRVTYGTDTGGGTQAKETTIMTSVPASIQLKRDKGSNVPSFPAPSNTDAAVPTWKIIIPSVALGVIKKADKITDDQGVTYEVDAPYWNSLGFQGECRLYKP